MKRISVLLFSLLFLNACSVFERKPDEESPPFEPSNADTALTGDPAEGAEGAAQAASQADRHTVDEVVAEASGQQAPSPEMEGEVARLNAKIAALETKISVLNETLDRERARNSQPAMRAVPNHADEGDPAHEAEPSQAAMTKADEPETAGKSSGNPEQDFRDAMRLFNASNFRDAANRFYAITKNNRSHLLASHALYWAGEAGARAGNWKVAISHWTNLERGFSRSIYMPEALAGLSNAHQAVANAKEAKRYKDTLLKAFPDAPAAAHLLSSAPESKRGKSAETVEE